MRIDRRDSKLNICFICGNLVGCGARLYAALTYKLRYTNGLDSSYLSDKTTRVSSRPGSVRAGQAGRPSQEHQNPNKHWCPSAPLIGKRLPRCFRRLVHSHRCWCHECRMRDWRARRPALPPARRPARTPTPLCSPWAQLARQSGPLRGRERLDTWALGVGVGFRVSSVKC